MGPLDDSGASAARLVFAARTAARSGIRRKIGPSAGLSRPRRLQVGAAWRHRRAAAGRAGPVPLGVRASAPPTRVVAQGGRWLRWPTWTMWSIRTWSDAARQPPTAVERESFDVGQTTMVKRETRLPRARRLLQTPGRAESAAWASRRYLNSASKSSPKHRPGAAPKFGRLLGD